MEWRTHTQAVDRDTYETYTCKAVHSAHVENWLEMQLQKEMDFEVEEAQNCYCITFLG